MEKINAKSVELLGEKPQDDGKRKKANALSTE